MCHSPCYVSQGCHQMGLSSSHSHTHFLKASTNCGNLHSSQLSSTLTRSDLIPGGLSRVSLTYPLISFFLSMDSKVWILVTRFSYNSLIRVGLVSVITDNPIMHWMWALATSLGFAYLVMRMFLARVYPWLLKGNPSMTALFLGTSSSFKYKILTTWAMSDLSIVASNCSQNLCQSRCVPWNFVITSLRTS